MFLFQGLSTGTLMFKVSWTRYYIKMEIECNTPDFQTAVEVNPSPPSFMTRCIWDAITNFSHNK